jgi:hypothetical protein
MIALASASIVNIGNGNPVYFGLFHPKKSSPHYFLSKTDYKSQLNAYK